MFILSSDTKIHSELNTKPIQLAIQRFYRDLELTLSTTRDIDITTGDIYLKQNSNVQEEAYIIDIDHETLTIQASDSLGCIYALNELSYTFLGIQPFWFWNDQVLQQVPYIEIETSTIESTPAAYRYRGWFVNDEVLINHWTLNGSTEEPWVMVMEALLRLGGNMVIPGTDHNSKKYSELASDMGLWITHHHAEPLGADMFLRAYPELNPSFDEHPDLFRALWEQGVQKQADKKVIWNIGFRGQGDRPFWLDDERYETDESRGRLIASIMEEQRTIVRKSVDNPVFCTNLYGEMVDLYQKGYLTIPEDTIKIWGDNGYGKMVARRQHGVDSRTEALPAEDKKHDSHGVYYHASFYDLQAASHMTMLPNSLTMVRDELVHARERGVNDFLIVNCSNIKPHVYVLQAIAEIWSNGDLDHSTYPERYVSAYYEGEHHGIAELYRKYANCAPRYGKHADEGCGDQFYNYSTRQFVSQWLKADTLSPVQGMNWACDEGNFAKQIQWYAGKCREALESYRRMLRKTADVRNGITAKVLLDDSIGLQYQMYADFAEGGLACCEAYTHYEQQDYMNAFYQLGRAKEAYESAHQSMIDREHGKWQGFYQNDCLTDVKQTAYWLGILMGVVRNIGDGPHFFMWQREVLYAPEDKKVILITNFENHLTNEELYEAMKKKQSNI
ncbi:glycosyl hydrolase 115 family protein [Paenibacillus tundrae]